MQAKKELLEYLNDSLINKHVESKVPQACKQSPCILGIDEAGRGPVLGPMTYAIAYYPQKSEEVLNTMKFADSKTLTESTREDLFESIQTSSGGFLNLGYMVKIISPNMISNSMLRRKKYNLNALSHDIAIDLIRKVGSKDIDIAHVYIDTVGDENQYKAKLQRFFPQINFTVAKKADSKYPIVSAASICAKVMRDRIVSKWKYPEASSLHLDAFVLGSGYPADPVTKKFLVDSVDPVFGYPTLARFSWSTITKALETGGCKCDWNEPEDDSQDQKEFTKQQEFMRRSFPKKAPKKSQPFGSVIGQTHTPSKPRTNADKFFQDRMLSKVTKVDW